MEQYHKLMFSIVGTVALTGAALLFFAMEQASDSDLPIGMAVKSRPIYTGTSIRCVRNFNCATGIECCGPSGCACKKENTGVQYGWTYLGKRYKGQEKITMPTSIPGVVLG